MTAAKENKSTTTEAQEWEGRRKNNLRLAYAMGAFAVAVFLISLWKYRPL